MSYSIIRHHFLGDTEHIKSGLTLEEAQAHCQDPNTRKEGIWFDGYREDTPKTNLPRKKSQRRSGK